MDRASLIRRHQELEEAIAEVTSRLPAHSVKPLIMNELLELEDELDQVRMQLKKVEAGSSDGEEPGL